MTFKSISLLIAGSLLLGGCEVALSPQARCEKELKKSTNLRDPASAIFRDFNKVEINQKLNCTENRVRMIFGCVQLNHNRGALFVGAMNSKNGFGGYGYWRQVFCVVGPGGTNVGYLPDCNLVGEKGTVNVC